MRPVIGLAALLALGACTEGPPPNYYIREACKSAGLAEGTAAFDSCVAERRMAALRQIYDLAIRDPIPPLAREP